MKKLILAAIIALSISTSAISAENCVATDYCMLFTNMEDMMRLVALYHQDGDAMKFALNELVVAGKLFKLDQGTKINVVARSGILCQVYHNNRILYTIEQGVKCK